MGKISVAPGTISQPIVAVNPITNCQLRITNWAAGGVRRMRLAAKKKPPFRKRGVGGIYTYTYTYTPPRQRPPPSFRRRPESRTPVYAKLRKGRGVDSRFRGNDDKVGWLKWRWLAHSVSPSPNPLPLGEGRRLAALSGWAVHTALAALYRRGARPCAPTPHHGTRTLPRNPPRHPSIRKQTYIYTQPNPNQPASTVIPALPSVIPAKAGIHTRPFAMPGPAGVLDSGLRRNDGVGAGGGSCGAA